MRSALDDTPLVSSELTGGLLFPLWEGFLVHGVHHQLRPVDQQPRGQQPFQCPMTHRAWFSHAWRPEVLGNERGRVLVQRKLKPEPHHLLERGQCGGPLVPEPVCGVPGLESFFQFPCWKNLLEQLPHPFVSSPCFPLVLFPGPHGEVNPEPEGQLFPVAAER